MSNEHKAFKVGDVVRVVRLGCTIGRTIGDVGKTFRVTKMDEGDYRACDDCLAASVDTPFVQIWNGDDEVYCSVELQLNKLVKRSATQLRPPSNKERLSVVGK